MNFHWFSDLECERFKNKDYLYRLRGSPCLRKRRELVTLCYRPWNEKPFSIGNQRLFWRGLRSGVEQNSVSRPNRRRSGSSLEGPTLVFKVVCVGEWRGAAPAKRGANRKTKLPLIRAEGGLGRYRTFDPVGWRARGAARRCWTGRAGRGAGSLSRPTNFLGAVLWPLHTELSSILSNRIEELAAVTRFEQVHSRWLNSGFYYLSLCSTDNVYLNCFFFLFF